MHVLFKAFKLLPVISGTTVDKLFHYNWEITTELSMLLDHLYDSVSLPGVRISALCMAGISLMRRSCTSGGMVMDRP